MTPTQEAAMRQALEAMEYTGMDVGKFNRINAACAALRAALAEPVLAPAPGYCKHCKQYTIEEPLPAEPVQEPVAWMYEDTLPKEYPYDAMWPHSAVRDGVRMFPVFAPPQRKPLTEDEIKDCETQAMVNGALPFEQRVFFARAIERAHGIKDE